VTTICFIRHGETDWNKLGKIQGKTDIPLNKNGKLQAEKISIMLKASEWDSIMTSPLIRAKETAEIIDEVLQLPFIEMNAFKERDFGDAEGLMPEERTALFSDRNYPNMEPRDLFIVRLEKGLSHIVQMYPHKKVLLVAHGGVINTILSVLSKGEIGSGKTLLANGCMSNIYFQEGIWHVKDYNQTLHLSSMQ